jgi:L-lactate dehydrogenase complex protein LldG
MTARDEILSRVRPKSRGLTPPPVWRSRRHFRDLAGRFAEALTAAKGEVIRAASLEDALARLSDVLRDLEAGKAVLNHEPPFDDLDIISLWPNIKWHFVGQSDGDLSAFCAGADVGIGGAEAALAETGTIVIGSGPGRSRLATLLPPVHVALVSTSCLTTDIFTWTAARQGNLPANRVLVSGPSKTADIEQTLVTGAHGPKRFIVVLYDD